jgi:small subunit ribosomal protein S16
LNNGAQPTDTVRDIFSKQGVMTALHQQKVNAAAKKVKKVATEEKPAKPSVKKTTTKKVAVKKAAAEKVEEK